MRSVLAIVFLAVPAAAGLQLSLEKPNPLPCDWRGFLPEVRRLRALAVPAIDASKNTSLLHTAYAEALLKLDRVNLTADELADRGALLIRFGSIDKALELLRNAHRKHPEHYAIASNLGTAYMLAGDAAAAVEILGEAERLAPKELRAAEALQRKLVQQRRTKRDGHDQIFELADPKALANVQQLLLWLPGDARLLWLAGETAYRLGDIRTAANILEGVVAEYALNSEVLRENRRKYRSEADEAEKKQPHEKSAIKFASAKPFARIFDESKLPEIVPDGVNPLSWAVLGETVIERPFKLKPLNHLAKLDGKRVSLVGYMRPIDGGKGGVIEGFLLTESPVGCWYCDVPEPTGLIAVELAEPAAFSRDPIRVEGVLRLNNGDPEDSLYRLEAAKLRPAD